jgi:FtsP/CotA-like multicopper oxidase with cupredoxin domain
LNRTLVVVLIVLAGLGALFFVLRPGPAADAPREQTVDIAIEDGAMTPEQIEVGEGDRVTLRMTTPGPPTEVHLHGYDLEEEVEPGEPATVSFEADLTGRFEIEDHETGEVLGALLVQPR